MNQKKHHITIKGTKDGLNFFLDDRCSFHELLKELEETLSSQHYQKDDGPNVQINLLVGNRFLTSEQEDELRKLIVDEKKLSIERIVSNVISKEEAERQLKDAQMVTVTKMIRSGQVLELTGDVLLIGDVNPGGVLVATGNIFVMGALRGIAHAGCKGNKEAVICASVMAPAQLKIADSFHQCPSRSEQEEREMECAYVDERNDEITIGRVQELVKIRPNLTKYLH